jgi:DNA-binding NarL/FixJ family response regulator
MGHEDVRVIVVEPRRLVREALARSLRERGGIELVAEAEDASALLLLLTEHDADVVVMNLDSGADDLLGVVPMVVVNGRGPQVVAVLSALDITVARRAITAGVTALVAADQGLGGIADVVRNPRRAPSVRLVEQPDDQPARRGVTRRELEVLRQISLGLTAREISDRMGISPKTVENHKQRLFRKLDVQNQAHAVSVALRHGVLQPADGLEQAVG